MTSRVPIFTLQSGEASSPLTAYLLPNSKGRQKPSLLSECLSFGKITAGVITVLHVLGKLLACFVVSFILVILLLILIKNGYEVNKINSGKKGHLLDPRPSFEYP